MIVVVHVPVVVAKAAVDLRGIVRGQHIAIDAGRDRIMDDQVDQLGAWCELVHAIEIGSRLIRVHHLESPIPGIRRDRRRPRSADVEDAVNRRPFARILPHHDGIRWRASEPAGELASVGASPKPDGVARMDGRAGERRGQIPGLTRAAIPARGPGGGYVIACVRRRGRRLHRKRCAASLAFARRRNRRRSRGLARD